MNKSEIGKLKEDIAVKFLKERGYIIIERNFRKRFGEIDIIAKDGNCLVFVEVRSRSYDTFGKALESIDIKKRMKLSKMANYYLTNLNQHFDEVRFDVVSITGDEIEHIKNAFEVKI
ncbi:MAG: YraN family protein [Hydrogenothermaceae bacterium]|nr:YraN family protein [Hydrogenothermaceae bacterium]